MKPFDPALAFHALNEAGVNYIVVGGLAGELLGAPLATNDIDICHERTPENMDRLAEALQHLDAKLRVPGVDDDLPFRLDGRTLAAGDSFTFETSAGDLDIRGTPRGTAGYTDLEARASEYDVGEGLIVRVVDLDDLIRMKEAAGRLKDETHLHQLAVLKEMLEEAKGPAES